MPLLESSCDVVTRLFLGFHVSIGVLLVVVVIVVIVDWY
jgi:hypothetical protein